MGEIGQFLYKGLFWFVVFFPIFNTVFWVLNAVLYRYLYESEPLKPVENNDVNHQSKPFVSVIIPAYNEEKILPHSLKAILSLSYSFYEVILVNDGSSDSTLEAVRPFMKDSKLRLLHKVVNQGKSLALNDALLCARGDVVVIFDGDVEPHADMIDRFVQSLQNSKCDAVTGHPVVKNIASWLSCLQAVEFFSLVSLVFRSQSIFGSLFSVFGAATAFRKEALYEAKGFNPFAYIEDADITWRLYKKNRSVIFEPRALFDVHIPETLNFLVKERIRWAKGIAQIFIGHIDIFKDRKLKKYWPSYIEIITLSVWGAAFSIMICFHLSLSFLSLFEIEAGFVLFDLSSFLILIAFVTIGQVFVGLLIEKRYYKESLKFLPYSLYYIFLYWFMVVLIPFLMIPSLFKKTNSSVKWETER